MKWWPFGKRPERRERVDHFIARFSDDLAFAETQEQRDNAAGRLRYWQKVKARV